jgi:dTDP-4-amino-4,6-dideoxygalactose transaminase
MAASNRLATKKAFRPEASSTDKLNFIDLGIQRARIRADLDDAIARVLDHGHYIMGPEVIDLEARLGEFSSARFAITCASGTDALLIALMARGVGRGDAVLCPAFTYPATPEAIALLGATPIFVDVHPDTFNIDPARLEAGLVTAKRHGLRSAAIIAVDLFGLPADYDALRAFGEKNNLWILADAAQSFGATYQDRKVGVLGDITATSFFPAKPLGCYGDGGAVFTDDATLAEKMRSIRLHGKGGHKYDIVCLGVNSRLDTLQAAILLEKLKIFEDEIARRDAIARRYHTALKDIVRVPTIPQHKMSVWAQFTICISNGRRDAIMKTLNADGIPTGVYYPAPLHQQLAYRWYPVAEGGLPISEHLPKEVLSLPMHPYLDPGTQDRIIESLIWAEKSCRQ